MFPDIFDHTVLTELIQRDYNELARNPGGGVDTTFKAVGTIAKLETVQGRKVRIRMQEVLPVGMAQPRSPGGSPALWTPRPQLREEVMGIVDWDEASQIDDEQLIRLRSSDDNIYKAALLDLRQLGVGLKERLDLRTEWLAWETLKGAVVVNYPNAGAQVINYGIHSSHFPTFGTPWTSTATSDPMTDLDSLGAVTIPRSGIFLPWFHMNDNTWRLMRRSKSIRDQLSSYGRSVMQPTEEDINALSLRPNPKFTIIDAGYLPENSTSRTLTKWIPDGQVLATPANYRYLNRPIMDIADGMVVVKPQGAAEPKVVQGEQSEIKSSEIPPYNVFVRQVASRLGRLYAPEAIAWGTAYTP